MITFFCIAMSQLWLATAQDNKAFKIIAGVVWLISAIALMLI